MGRSIAELDAALVQIRARNKRRLEESEAATRLMRSFKSPAEERAYFAKVDRNPRWKRRWWEPEPAPQRTKIPSPTRRALAEKYGAVGDGVFPVACLCGAAGQIERSGWRVRFIDIEIDHVLPVARGGGDELDNLQLLCPCCNREKSARVGFVPAQRGA